MASGAIDLFNVLVSVAGIIVNMPSEGGPVMVRVPLVGEMRKRFVNVAEWISMGGFGDWSAQSVPGIRVAVEHLFNEHEVEKAARAEGIRAADSRYPNALPRLTFIRAAAATSRSVGAVLVLARAKGDDAALKIGSTAGLREPPRHIIDGFDDV